MLRKSSAPLNFQVETFAFLADFNLFLHGIPLFSFSLAMTLEAEGELT